MIILGISALDKESTVSLVHDGILVAGISEERLTRVKQQKGFPALAIAEICRISNIDIGDIDAVAYPFFACDTELQMRRKNMSEHLARNFRESQPLWHKISHWFRYKRLYLIEHRDFLSNFDKELIDGLEKLGLLSRLKRYDHQLCHAASAVYTSGFDRALAVTMDNYGSGASASVFAYDGNKLEHLTTVPYPNSMGIFYALVTKNLGFRPDRHEGKILGLAAYGDPMRLYDQVRSRFVIEHKNYFYKSVFHQKPDLYLASKFSREDVSAAYQKVLEEVVVRFVKDHLEETGFENVALAGGTFANVKLNQRIAELAMVNKLYVHPAMSDMGTGAGAALAHAESVGRAKPYAMPNALLGPEYSDQEIKTELDRAGVKAEFCPDIERRIAELLAAGSVIGRFNGAMEYGPRALGNRSVLSRATDPAINKVLNDRLKRTEFMPFAPATLAEEADRCYVGIDKAEHSAQFMTITFDCTEFMKDKSPAAVHVDGTARPQLVTEQANPSFYRIIREYYKLTGIPSIINTSFNIHEEPIICTPSDAIKTFQDGRLDYLAMGHFLLKCASESFDEGIKKEI